MSGAGAHAAFSQAWPAFALVAGLLLIGATAAREVCSQSPVLLHAARQRGIPDGAFLYGAVFMANSASLLLPGSNLTNP